MKQLIKSGTKLSKEEQKNVFGGRRLNFNNCASICATASAGTPCGPPHCPAICDGHGGWINL